MNKVTDWTEVGLQSLVALGESVMSSLPNIIGAIFMIILGWIIAKVLSYVVRKALKLIGFDKLSDKMNLDEVLNKMSFTITPSRVVGKFVYWVIILLFFVTASDILGWAVVSTSISGLISYLPQLFSAIVIFVIGFYIASFVKKGLKGVLESLSIASSYVISSFAFYMILVIISIAALDQAGIDIAILISNVTIIVGGIVLAFAVSFGIGSKDVLSNILSSFYTRKTFEPGQIISLEGVSGTIERIDNTSCIIKTTGGMTVIPVKRLLNEKVEIKDAK
jgi:small-conductance mechanosensitive channel